MRLPRNKPAVVFSEADDPLSYHVIGAAIKVHRSLGPGLLESVYEACLAYELTKQNIPFERQKPIPVLYDDVYLDCGFRVDILVNDQLLLELKSVEQLAPVHSAQILTYMKLTGVKKGLLINFNVKTLVEGIKRYAQ